MTKTGEAPKHKANLRDYLVITRLEHSTKHIFIVPGVALAYLLRDVQNNDVYRHLVFGLLAAVCIASANYVINEWHDRHFDKHHPSKSQRTAVRRELREPLVLLEWIVLLVLGLASAWFAGPIMCAIAGLFGLQGVMYNIPPMRTKEIPYLDVLSESVNNPLRLMIGWAMIDATTLPPSSILLSYLFGGAFLMAAKRLSEYREIVASHGRELLVKYRASFAGYSDISLTVSCFLYAMLSTFFLAVFLIKYRVEYLLLMPLIVIFFCQYLTLAMHPGSSAQKPEKLFQERGLMAMVSLLIVAFLATTFIDIKAIEGFTQQQFIALS